MPLLHRRVGVREQVRARGRHQAYLAGALRHVRRLHGRQQRRLHLQPGEREHRQDAGPIAHDARPRLGGLRAREVGPGGL